MMNENGMIPYEIRTVYDFRNILARLKKHTKYIEIVRIDGMDNDDRNILAAEKTMIPVKVESTDRWLGTVTTERAFKYTFEVKDSSYFDYLNMYDSFYFAYHGRWGEDMTLNTEFGLDDIAFLDKDKQPLFYTITHEGYAFVRPDILAADIIYSFGEQRIQ